MAAPAFPERNCYEWLVHPHGAGVSVSLARPHFARRSRWRPQNEGLAIALTLDRGGVRAWPPLRDARWGER